MTTNDGENKAIMGKQPDYSWQSSPLTSDHCPVCKGTGRVKKGAGDLSPLERENTELLRKLGRCHRSMKLGIHIIQRMSARTHWDGCEKVHPECMAIRLMRDALTDRGGANPE